ncbi:metallophosphoesterase [bacterium]|nr:metallophosphoesterase [bacterium]
MKPRSPQHHRTPLVTGTLLFVLLLLAVPSTQAKSLRFLVLGDWGRDGNHHQMEVAQIMGEVADTMAIDFVVSTGDNFYNSGVMSVEDEQWRTSFEDIYTASSLQVPWYVALGNHDYRGDVDAQIEYSEESTRWRMPDKYYSFQYALEEGKIAQFFVLDTNRFPFWNTPWRMIKRLWSDLTGEQEEWFREELSQSDAEWKIVIAHHAVYSTGSRHGDIEVLQETFVPLLTEFGVQAWFNGHDHNLQHQDPPESDVQFFTSGAGSKLQDLDEDVPGQTRFAQSTSGFMAVSLDSEQMVVQLIDFEGTLLYETVVNPDGTVQE